ncbi:MAG: hypothetical protein ABIV51_00925 [Saprospiraceae bacterium]
MQRKWLFIALLFCFAACKQEDTQLNRDDLTEIDTLFRNIRVDLAPKMDSLCLANKRQIYDQAFDSIFQERMARINRLKQLQ